MGDIPGLKDAAAQLQGQLAKSNLSELRQAMAGLTILPEGVTIESRASGTGAHAELSSVNHDRYNAVTLMVSSNSLTVSSVTRSEGTNTWHSLSTKEEQARVKDEVKAALKEAPELAPYLKGAKFPDQSQVIEPNAPAQAPQKQR